VRARALTGGRITAQSYTSRLQAQNTLIRQSLDEACAVIRDVSAEAADGDFYAVVCVCERVNRAAHYFCAESCLLESALRLVRSDEIDVRAFR
jgi:hypothetical protein